MTATISRTIGGWFVHLEQQEPFKPVDVWEVGRLVYQGKETGKKLKDVSSAVIEKIGDMARVSLVQDNRVFDIYDCTEIYVGLSTYAQLKEI